MSQKNLELSIIIVNYNTKELTLECLKSVIQAKKNTDLWEIIIVDNGSSDDSVEFLTSVNEYTVNKSWIRILALDNNYGFSAGNNKGLAIALGKTVLLLNSDTEIQSDAIQVCLKKLYSSSKIGVVGSKLFLPNGNIDPACHRGFPTPWASFSYFVGMESLFPHSSMFSQYHQWYKQMNSAHQVDAISGGFFMVRKEVIDQVGVLDEAFFMYGEDLDWAFRIKENGWEIWYEPLAKVLHKKKQSGRNNSNLETRKKTKEYFYSTMKLFYKKHYQNKYSALLTIFVITIINMRLFIVKKFGL